jgi:hypothetical protein
MLIGSLKRCVFAACVALWGCAGPIRDETDFAVVMPSRSTSNSEITNAIQELIKTYPVCVSLRPLRMVGRPGVSFESPRDDDAMADLDILVHLGYLTKTASPDPDKHGFKFDFTERGKDKNIIESNHFCLPAERVLVSVTNIERAAHVTALAVDFTHRLDPKSIWAQEPALVKLMAGDRAVLQPGPIKGRALLSRVWVRGEHSLQGAPDSGALWAVSWDPVHNRFEGGRWGAVSLNLWGVN